jgi:hypothetical protein
LIDPRDLSVKLRKERPDKHYHHPLLGDDSWMNQSNPLAGLNSAYAKIREIGGHSRGNNTLLKPNSDN